MGKSSPDKKKRDLDFIEIGEFETIEKRQKIQETIINEDGGIKPIYFDGRQYSCKIPMKVMESIGYKESDGLKFTLIKIPSKGKVMVKIEYVRT